MNRISFLMILCILGIVKTTNAQQLVNREEVKNAAINMLYKKSYILKTSSEARIEAINTFYNKSSDTLKHF